MTATEAAEYIDRIEVAHFQRYPPADPTEVNIHVEVFLTDSRSNIFKTKVPYSEVSDSAVEENFISPAKDNLQDDIISWVEDVGTRGEVEGSDVTDEW